MKVIAIILFLVSLIVASFLFAATKEVTLYWQQTPCHDLVGWNLYSNIEPGVQPIPENLVYTVLWDGILEEWYSDTITITARGNKLIRYYFVMTAFTDTYESAPSNEVYVDVGGKDSKK